MERRSEVRPCCSSLSSSTIDGFSRDQNENEWVTSSTLSNVLSSGIDESGSDCVHGIRYIAASWSLISVGWMANTTLLRVIPDISQVTRSPKPLWIPYALY